MENVITSRKSEFFNFDNLHEIFIDDQESLEISIDKSSVDSKLSKNDFEFSFEDSQSFLKNLFRDKETILNENWQINEIIHGKVVNFNDNEVYVDCLTDIDNFIFESRVFPKYLFDNLVDFKKNKPVLIKSKLKPGSTRIDIFPGEGIVNLRNFESRENWNSLKGKKLDTKLVKW